MARRLLVLIFLSMLLGVVGAQQRNRGQEQERRPQPTQRPTEPQLGGRQQRREPQEFSRDTQDVPHFISGKVTLEDGSAPPEPVRVDMVCHGRIVRQFRTSSNGHFGFRLGDRNTDIADASVSGAVQGGFGNSPVGGGLGVDSPTNLGSRTGQGNVNLTGCDLRTSLAGFEANTIHLGIRRYLDNPNVGVIVLRRRDKVAGTAISLNTLGAPKKAKKSYQKALKELAKKKAKPSRAVKELEKAVKLYPEFSAAWNLLGQLRLATKDRTGAQEAFERAVAVEPNYVGPYLPLALLRLDERRWKDAAQLSRQVLEQNPDVINAHYSLGVASYFLGNLDAAEKSSRKILNSSEARNYPRMRYLLGIVLAGKGNFPSAAAELRRYLEIIPDAPEAEPLKEELQKWEAEGRIRSAGAADTR